MRRCCSAWGRSHHVCHEVTPRLVGPLIHRSQFGKGLKKQHKRTSSVQSCARSSASKASPAREIMREMRDGRKVVSRTTRTFSLILLMTLMVAVASTSRTILFPVSVLMKRCIARYRLRSQSRASSLRRRIAAAPSRRRPRDRFRSWPRLGGRRRLRRTFGPSGFGYITYASISACGRLSQGAPSGSAFWPLAVALQGVGAPPVIDDRWRVAFGGLGRGRRTALPGASVGG